MIAYWSWILTAVGVFGLYLAGRKSPWGWAVGIGAQVLWFAYAVTTRQWGFIVSCLAYGAVYVRNFRAWRTPAAETPSDVLVFHEPLTEAEYEEIKARWLEAHGNNQGAHNVTELCPADEEESSA